MAAIQAYPTVRFYPGRIGWSAAQNPIGIQMVSERRKVEDVVEWLEDVIAQQQQKASANTQGIHTGRDEL